MIISDCSHAIIMTRFIPMVTFKITIMIILLQYIQECIFNSVSIVRFNILLFYFHGTCTVFECTSVHSMN